MSVEHLPPTLKHVGAVDALKVRLEAATAWRRSVGAVDGSWCDLDERALEAKIDAAIALAREPEPNPHPRRRGAGNGGRRSNTSSSRPSAVVPRASMCPVAIASISRAAATTPRRARPAEIRGT
jgi:hypothetical protein